MCDQGTSRVDEVWHTGGSVVTEEGIDEGFGKVGAEVKSMVCADFFEEGLPGGGSGGEVDVSGGFGRGHGVDGHVEGEGESKTAGVRERDERADVAVMGGKFLEGSSERERGCPCVGCKEVNTKR